MICITLGNKTDLCITEDNHLVLIQKAETGGSTSMDLGLATKIRIEQLQDYLGRLYCHGLEEGKAA